MNLSVIEEAKRLLGSKNLGPRGQRFESRYSFWNRSLSFYFVLCTLVFYFELIGSRKEVVVTGFYRGIL